MSDIIKLGKDACSNHKKTGKIEFPEGMSHNDFGVWCCIFEQANDWVGWEKVTLQGIRETIIQAKHNLNKVSENESITEKEIAVKSMLSIISMTATSDVAVHNTNHINSKLPNLKKKIVDLWISEFTDYPNFAIEFKKDLESSGLEEETRMIE